MIKRYLMVLLVASLVPLLMGISLFKPDENKILQKGNHTWVRLKKADKGLRGTLGHPAELTDEQMEAALASVRYFRPAPFSIKKDKGKEFDLLKPSEHEFFAPYLARALERATPEQWVDFSLEYFRGQGYIGIHRVTNGVIFIKDGELNIAFRDIASRISPDELIAELNPIHNHTGFERLVPREGHRLAVTQGRRKKITHENWIIMPVASLAQVAAPAEPALVVPAPQPAQQVAQPAPAPAQPVAEVAPAPTQPAPPAVKKSAKERMLELRELYDAGFITEEEYEKKRQAILDDL